MKKVLLIATLLGGASAYDETCWLKQENMFMPCLAKDRDTKGTLAEKMTECKELEDDCRGVTCSIEGQCTVRHHHQCEGGDFLEKSDDKETTYVKICEVSKHVWEQHDDQYIPCYAKSDEASGSLLERKMRCAELGNDCIGVTCKYDNAADKAGSAKECTVRDYRAGCGSGGFPLADSTAESMEISFTMDPVTSSPSVPSTPSPPFGEDCTFETFDLQTFSCNAPRDTDKRYTLADAKAVCISMKETKNFCNGIVCSSKDPTIESCAVHKHCVSEGKEMFKAASSVVHIKRCTEGNWCMSPCHSTIEFRGHVCKSDCDCAGLRSCSAQGYCTDPKGLQAEEELCIDDSECKYEKHVNKFMPCDEQALVDAGSMSLGNAQKRCTEMRGQCAGVTCENGKCTLRNHLLETCEKGVGLKYKVGETTYLKCCGPERDLRCPGSSGGSGGGHAGVLIFLVIVLLAVVAVLAYKKHQMEKDYVAPNEFNAVPQDEEQADNNWIIEDTKEEQ